MIYETIIGLEIHVELKTKTKIFCSCSTEFGAEPNSHTCPICLGLPGTLPVLNDEVINLAIKAGKILNCEINKLNKMDRKNYFYPDLPKAYQISQYDLPICKDGSLEFEYDGEIKKVRINRIHIEEDAGKLIHPEGEAFSLIDYNRVGVPLAEIVTEPDIHSPGEAVAFLKKLKLMFEYAGISDCKMEEGSLRCDANISLRPVGQKKFNPKVEIKNINSFKEIQKALEREEKRQKELYDFNEGYKVKQETRRYDSAKARTVTMRSKEDAHDYRYFEDPDLVPIVIEDKLIQDIENSIPELPETRLKRFMDEYKLSKDEADIIIGDKALSDFYEEVVKYGTNPKIACNWILRDVLMNLKEKGIECSDMKLSPIALHKIIKLIEDGKINITVARKVFNEVFDTGKDPYEIVEEKGLSQISSTDVLEKIIDDVLSKNTKSIEDFKNGKKQALGYIVGQVMKETKGKANPKLASQIIKSKITK